uniref:Uncharacterized LOC100175113 n=1 Tax=Ciona intestinalis TaxID=7719 RepID=A0A1W5BB42_CIOIN|nr:uncharacterized protein LOC100175113 [Ciona intestinalis]XP_018669623.1 uncharacterized protein LOC100175113 [Ciona intestinalis]|eukprot:XP_018669621.1 uncharacterized protein LOC100175113 [Ciona intestinalis]
MAPQTASTGNVNLINGRNAVSASKELLDCNHNAVISEKAAQQQATVGAPNKRPSNGGDVNDRSRKLIKSCFTHLNTNLNVLVIGAKGAGKSSLINSMNMALTQEWKDRAKYCPGRNHVIDECVMFHNKKAGGKVVFWDTRGFEDIHADDHAILILRYVLEGRIPAKCIPCVLLMSKEIIKKRYHKISETKRRIDLVLFVSSLTEEPNTRLMSLTEQAITTSKHTCVNRVPIVSVATKSDLFNTVKPDELHDYSLEHVVTERRDSARASRRSRLATVPEVVASAKVVDNYRCELEPWSDESANPSMVKSSPDRDALLLSVWREIVSRTAACAGNSDRRKRAYSASSRPMCRCLPFKFDYMRLRSASF